MLHITAEVLTVVFQCLLVDLVVKIFFLLWYKYSVMTGCLSKMAQTFSHSITIHTMSIIPCED